MVIEFDTTGYRLLALEQTVVARDQSYPVPTGSP
jgi:hypothetical protein